MFCIKMALPEEIEKTEHYLGGRYNGFLMACTEEGALTGAVAFNIAGREAYIEALKTDKPEMEQVVLSAALNFLEQNRFFDVYMNIPQYRPLCEKMGFVPCAGGPVDARENFLAKLNLRGYFDHHKHD